MTNRFLLFTFIFVLTSINSFSQVEDTTYQEVEGVLVSSEKERQIVFEDTKFYVIDFAFMEERTFLLLRNMGKYVLTELDEQLALKQELQLEQNANSLFTDCFGNIHLVAKDSAYLILTGEAELSLTEPQPTAEFLGAMKKCVAMTSEKLIFEEYRHYYQFHAFYTVDASNGERKTIYEINDSIRAYSLNDAAEDLYSKSVNLAEIMRSDEMYAEIMHSGADELVSNRIQREMNARMDRIIFFETIVVVPEYNPLFVVNDTLCFFNHSEGRLDRLDQSGKQLSSCSIEHHLNSGWQHEIYFDRAREQFYGLFLNDGTYEINTIAVGGMTGDFSTSPITEYARPKKILIRDGYAYYTFRPTSDAHLNKLYRQKL